MRSRDKLMIRFSGTSRAEKENQSSVRKKHPRDYRISKKLIPESTKTWRVNMRASELECKSK